DNLFVELLISKPAREDLIAVLRRMALELRGDLRALLRVGGACGEGLDPQRDEGWVRDTDLLGDGEEPLAIIPSRHTQKLREPFDRAVLRDLLRGELIERSTSQGHAGRSVATLLRAVAQLREPDERPFERWSDLRDQLFGFLFLAALLEAARALELGERLFERRLELSSPLDPARMDRRISEIARTVRGAHRVERLDGVLEKKEALGVDRERLRPSRPTLDRSQSPAPSGDRIAPSKRHVGEAQRDVGMSRLEPFRLEKSHLRVLSLSGRERLLPRDRGFEKVRRRRLDLAVDLDVAAKRSAVRLH